MSAEAFLPPMTPSIPSITILIYLDRFENAPDAMLFVGTPPTHADIANYAQAQRKN
jgi:hypothetical protein